MVWDRDRGAVQQARGEGSSAASLCKGKELEEALDRGDKKGEENRVA